MVRLTRTRIVCTLGPATDSDERIAALLRAGMNVARFNFSHGTHADHARRIEQVRRLAAQNHLNVALLGDLQGPKIRVGEIPGGELPLRAGSTLFLIPVAASQGTNAPDSVEIVLPMLGEVTKPAEHILLDDGNLDLEVVASAPDRVETRVVTGGVLRSHKGVNLPDADLPIASLTEKDHADLAWAVTQNLDYIALSFVRRASDVEDLRAALKDLDASLPIIAKIEKSQALAEMDAILQAADGVMVARGDLGVEIPAEQVPIYQKKIIAKANALGKPVITATQMLESMTHNPRPTRAEASDVANAILDGTDAVMLSGETSIGEYPVEAVQAMARIADFVERRLHEYLRVSSAPNGTPMSVSNAIGLATVEMAVEVGAKLIITLTSSGFSARMVARHRPDVPILAVTPSESTQRRLALVWGVGTVRCNEDGESEGAVRAALQAAREGGWAEKGDRVVLTAGVPSGISGRTNMIQVREIEA